jgi:hypothetical protein
LLDRCNQAVSTSRYGLDVAWSLWLIAEGCPDLLNAGVESTLKIDERVATPNLALNFLTQHDPASPADEQRQDSAHLWFEPYHLISPMQFARNEVHDELAYLHQTALLLLFTQLPPLGSRPNHSRACVPKSTFKSQFEHFQEVTRHVF